MMARVRVFLTAFLAVWPTIVRTVRAAVAFARLLRELESRIERLESHAPPRGFNHGGYTENGGGNGFVSYHNGQWEYWLVNGTAPCGYGKTPVEAVKDARGRTQNGA